MAIDLTKMLEKRREVLGEGDKFDVTIEGKTFWLVAPEIASEEFNEKIDTLREDAKDELISTADMRVQMLDLFLGEQVEAFDKAAQTSGIDAFTFLQWALSEHADEVRKNPTRPSSRNTRKPAKRR